MASMWGNRGGQEGGGFRLFRPRVPRDAVTDEQRASLHGQLDSVSLACNSKRDEIAAKEAVLTQAQDAFMQAELRFNVALDHIGKLVDAPDTIDELRDSYSRTRNAAVLVGEEEAMLSAQRLQLALNEARLGVLREAVERLPAK